MSVSVVIPVYNAFEFVRGCIESIFAARTAIPFEVIVVDNGSAAEVGVWLQEAARRWPGLRILHFDDPLGFARAVNEGMREARGEHLVILNSDTVVTDGWLDVLHQALAANPTLGIVSPVAARSSRTGLRREPQRLVFFCVMIVRSLWERAGGLDEIYRQGNFEDDDFCARARLLGYELAVVNDVLVTHHERKSFDDNHLSHAESLLRNQEIFLGRIARWSVGPVLTRLPARPSSGRTTVLVPAPPHRTSLVRDSLRSLANQTVPPFEVLLLSESEIPTESGLSVRAIRVPAGRGGNIAALLNEGMRHVTGNAVAFCTPGDIWFPFHLENLQSGLDDGAASAYTAWSFQAGPRHGAVRFDQAEPDRVFTGDWIPLACWICSLKQALPAFGEHLGDLTAWPFAADRIRKAAPAYLSRVSCRKYVYPVDVPLARGVLASIGGPADAWHDEERRLFLLAAGQGAWEATLILRRNEMERRARSLLAPPPPLRGNPRELERCAARLQAAALSLPPEHRSQTSLADVILLSILSWDDLTQRPHHIARGLAQAGHRVFWIDVALHAPDSLDSATLTRQLEPNLFRVELPALTGDLYRAQWSPALVNTMEAAFRFLQSAFGIEAAVQLVNFPKWWPLVERLRAVFAWPVVYDCLDDQQAFGAMHRYNDAHFEPALIQAATVLVTSGRTLYERHRSSHANTLLIPNAADYALFSGARRADHCGDLPRPVIGFFGAFAEWLDRDWIAQAARRFPHWSFVYIGREGFTRSVSRREWNALSGIPNIRVLPQVAPEVLAGYLAEFDVCTMPFRDLPITRAMNAVKIYEYLAAGKPVVAPDLPETRPLADAGLIDVYADTPRSFELLEEAVANGAAPAKAQARQRFAAANTWQHRVRQFRDVLL